MQANAWHGLVLAVGCCLLIAKACLEPKTESFCSKTAFANFSLGVAASLVSEGRKAPQKRLWYDAPIELPQTAPLTPPKTPKPQSLCLCDIHESGPLTRASLRVHTWGNLKVNKKEKGPVIQDPQEREGKRQVLLMMARSGAMAHNAIVCCKHPNFAFKKNQKKLTIRASVKEGHTP